MILPETGQDSFIVQANIELKRAERYRIFVSLIVIDLTFVAELAGAKAEETVLALVGLARGSIRSSDSATLIENHRLALLFPETSRQNAVVAAQRLTESFRSYLSEASGPSVEHRVIPLEVASYPDAAGAKTLAGFLEELTASRQN